jgi:hypothetical protein
MQEQYKTQIDLLRAEIRADESQIQGLSNQIGELNQKITEIEHVRRPLQKLNIKRSAELQRLLSLKMLDGRYPDFRTLSEKQKEYLVQWDKQDAKCYVASNNGSCLYHDKAPYGFLAVLDVISDEDLSAIATFIDIENKHVVYKSNGYDEADDVYIWPFRKFVFRPKQIAILFPSEAPPPNEIKRKRCSNCLHELND